MLCVISARLIFNTKFKYRYLTARSLTSIAGDRKNQVPTNYQCACVYEFQLPVI